MSKRQLRGADLVVTTLTKMGVNQVFSLSGNHIMPLYDALVDAPIRNVHMRHEAACVHAADAYARVTGEAGIALVTAGPGHANAVAALYTARCADSPVVLLSGHARSDQIGQGAFQELRQAEAAAPFTKASWTAQSATGLGEDLARALRIARSGRPGPVNVNLPADLLEKSLAGHSGLVPDEAAARPTPLAPSAELVSGILTHLAQAHQPIVICGPHLCNTRGRSLMSQVQHALQVPVIGMESPRGVRDPGLGDFAHLLGQADLLILIGKPVDFTLNFAHSPPLSPECRLIVVDADAAQLAASRRLLEDRLWLSAQADSHSTLLQLTRATDTPTSHAPWLAQALEALHYRPSEWDAIHSPATGPVHPLDLCRSLQDFFTRHPQATLVCDGGEIGQWPQAAVTTARKQLINGVAGTIGPSLPSALGVRLAEPEHPVVVVVGDGSFGFHMAELDTAVRHRLPILVVVGNDARWNAEYQIQLNTYGKDRAQGCELLPVRYDQVAEALGAHGEYVTRAAELPAALQRAQDSGKPACINVMIQSVAAPVIRRT